MAKHPFASEVAERIKQEMADGVVFAKDNPTKVFVGNQSDTPPSEPQEKAPVEEKVVLPQDKIIQMQEEELARLRAMEQSWKQQQTQANERTTRELELEKELAELRNQLAASATSKQEQDIIEEIMSQANFDSENFEDEALVEIKDRFVAPVAKVVKDLREKQAKLEAKLQGPTAEELRIQNQAKAITAVKEKIPTFDTIFNSKAFQEKLANPDPRFPEDTYGRVMQTAYERGNAEFIIREVQAFMNGNTAPDLEAIADVGATNGVGSKTQGAKTAPTFEFSTTEAAEMLHKYRIGDISRDDYRNYVKELVAHRNSK